MSVGPSPEAFGAAIFQGNIHRTVLFGLSLTDQLVKWFERLTSYAQTHLDSGAPAILAGDFNVMPTDLDVYAPERWVDDALFRPEVREAYRRLVAQGWVAALGFTGTSALCATATRRLSIGRCKGFWRRNHADRVAGRLHQVPRPAAGDRRLERT